MKEEEEENVIYERRRGRMRGTMEKRQRDLINVVGEKSSGGEGEKANLFYLNLHFLIYFFSFI